MKFNLFPTLISLATITICFAQTTTYEAEATDSTLNLQHYFLSDTNYQEQNKTIAALKDLVTYNRDLFKLYAENYNESGSILDYVVGWDLPTDFARLSTLSHAKLLQEKNFFLSVQLNLYSHGVLENLQNALYNSGFEITISNEKNVKSVW
eukprot:Pgem_evm1s2866